MKKLIFEKRTRLDASAEEVFAWHMAPGALEKLTPPGERVTVLEGGGEPIEEGSRVTLRIGGKFLGQRWVAEHRGIISGRQFMDVMVQGPFAHWEHTHRFEPAEGGGSWLIDHIEFAPPFGILGRLFLGRFLRRKLQKTFDFRHATTATELSSRGTGGNES